MRFVGALVFASASIINSIVCPGFPAGYFPRADTIPRDYRTLVVTPEEYPGAYIRDQMTGHLNLIQMPFGAFIKEDIIIGRNFEGRLYPVYNSEGNVTTRNMATNTTELITMENAQELGLLSYLAARAREINRARARARAGSRASVPAQD